MEAGIAKGIRNEKEGRLEGWVEGRIDGAKGNFIGRDKGKWRDTGRGRVQLWNLSISANLRLN
jgi:hypothetical protein